MKNLPHLKAIAGISLAGWLAALLLLLIGRPEWLGDDSRFLVIALLLAVIPYVVLCGVLALVEFSIPFRRLFCVVSLLVGIAGFVLHVMCLDGGCMTGFVIILAPLYQLIGVGVAVAIALFSKLVAYIDGKVAEARRSKV